MDKTKITKVNVIQMARIPTEPVSPNLVLNLALAVLLGLAGGLILAVVLKYADDNLERPEDVEEALGLPVLACVPLMQKKRFFVRNCHCRRSSELLQRAKNRARGYFVSTVGLEQAMVRAYIQNQDEEDKRYEQMRFGV